MDNCYKRALEVMEENFGHIVEMALASVSNNVVSIRDLLAYYNDGKMYVLSKVGNSLMKDIAVCQSVALCHGQSTMQGTVKDLGHPLLPQNKDLRARLKKEFSMDYTEYATESDERMRILEITLTKAETFTRYHRYEIDFVAQTAERDHTQPKFVYR